MGSRMRIGELSRRVGVTVDVLRAWERRYGLLRPERSSGGYRLYSEEDEWRVRFMQERLRGGVRPAEAAEAVTSLDREQAAPGRADSLGSEELVTDLRLALEEFDDEGAHLALDRLFALLGLERSVRDVLIPYLHEIGERWARGEVTVGQEHFASRLIEGRLLALARGWNKGPGPRSILACPPHELHTIPLIGFGLVLRNHGWRNIYLGADTPASSIRMAAETVNADVIVLSAVTSERYFEAVPEVQSLLPKRRVVLGGAGVSEELSARFGVECLRTDPVTAAEWLSVEHATARSGSEGILTHRS